MKNTYFILMILIASIMTSCKDSPTDELKEAVEKMEKISLNEITEKNLEEFDTDIQAIKRKMEQNETKLTPEELKQWNYWMGRFYALKVKIAFYPLRFLGENIMVFAEGFLNGMGINTSEMEDGIKEGLELFDTNK